MARQWLWFVLLLIVFSNSIRAGLYDWLLYSNDEKKSDCFLYKNRYFCHSQFNDNLTKEVNPTCIDGTPWSFFELKQNRITTDELIQWLIPFHIIEEYAAYLNSIDTDRSDSTSLCNCTANRVGSKCEYEIVSRTLDIAAMIKNQRGTYRDENYQIPATFIDEMPCNAGALGLEWRQICDGIVQCQDAIDEFNCDLLESHQCDVDEFQCRNGMCIPKEFLYDFVPECMDTSDEQELAEVYHMYDQCEMASSMNCDERLCRKDEFSCGDGTCRPWTIVISHGKGCDNGRDAAYICETVDSIASDEKKWGGICRATSSPLSLLTNTSDCLSSLRHMLTATRKHPAPATRERSYQNIIDRCPELIQYPERAVLSPVLKMYYNKSWIKEFYQSGQNFSRQMPRKAHWFCLNGTMICNGIWMTLEKDYCMDQDEFDNLTSYPYFPISNLFCQLAMKQESFESTSSSMMFYSCQNTTDRRSLRRVNDGYFDCLHGDDERNSFYTAPKLFQYKCQTTIPVQYVSYQQLGNGIKECADGSDEISRELRWSLFRCDTNDNYACWVFQSDGITENRINEVKLSFYRHCDSVWDTMDGRDERNCSQWICAYGTYQCNRTGQCIDSTYFCDGEFDCDDGEDELNCSRSIEQWNLELNCDNTYEHFCITPEYLQNQTSERPCIPYFKAGDSQIDCIGGRDERNVFPCSDHLVLGDRFLCDNQTKCLNNTLICNGIDDCVDQTDELICFWNRSRCRIGSFACPNGNICRNRRCNRENNCLDKADLFWCPSMAATTAIYRSSKYERLFDYEKSCYLPGTNSIKTSSVPIDTNEVSVLRKYGYCNRGFYLTIENGEKLVCFCPPSFYGDRCQYNSRRITIIVRFDRRHRLDLPSILTVLVSLVYNNSQIIDHRYFFDIGADYPPKADFYLLYPRPRLHGLYTVRFEAYDVMNFLGAWEYTISPFDFLPAFRLAKILRFPDRSLPWLCSHNQCQNNGTCYMMNSDQHLCLCQRGWFGKFCEKILNDIKCAPNALARDRDVCICPFGYVEPHCLVGNTVCERSHSCPSKQMCYPGNYQPPNWYRCVCNTTNCDTRKTFITIERQGRNLLPYLLQLLKISSDYPRVRQQILVHPSTDFPITLTIKTRDMRNVQGTVPEIGLLYTFQPSTESVDINIHLLFINCSTPLRNYTVDLDTQPQQCRWMSQVEFPSLTLLRSFCQTPGHDPCFQIEGYICYCHSQSIEQSECISYYQRYDTCTHCLNEGHCVQGDLQNTSDFTCVCPKCASGKLCQFTPSRFSISLEFLVVKANWNSYHYVGPSLFFIIGMIFNSLSLITFAHPKICNKAIGIYLLINSIVSQLVLVFFFIRILYLDLARHMIISEEINRGLCKSLPYLMSCLYYISLWLMAFVTSQRALVATFPGSLLFLRSARSAIILTLVISIIIFGSNYIHIDQYKLVSHPDDRYPWCISEIKPSEQSLVQYMALAHQIIPFLTNFIAGFAIIIAVNRSKATSHHLRARSILLQQIRQRIDLLLGPIICVITQIPQMIILFLDVCDYNSTSWFVHLTLVAYYISFTPQIILFFLFILPSPLYGKTLFKETGIGKQLVKMIPSLAHLVK